VNAFQDSREIYDVDSDLWDTVIEDDKEETLTNSMEGKYTFSAIRSLPVTQS